jgi:hypothetical protein
MRVKVKQLEQHKYYCSLAGKIVVFPDYFVNDGEVELPLKNCDIEKKDDELIVIPGIMTLDFYRVSRPTKIKWVIGTKRDWMSWDRTEALFLYNPEWGWDIKIETTKGVVQVYPAPAEDEYY